MKIDFRRELPRTAIGSMDPGTTFLSGGCVFLLTAQASDKAMAVNIETGFPKYFERTQARAVVDAELIVRYGGDLNA